MLLTARSLKDMAQVRILLRKAGLDSRIMEFLPANKRTPEYFSNLFQEKGLGEIVTMQKSLEKEGGIKELMLYLAEHLHDNTASKDISLGINELAKKHNINEATIISTVRLSL